MNVPELKLYRLDGACSLVCHALLRDLNIRFEEVLVKPGPNGTESQDGSFSAEDFLKISHMGNIPAMTVDGVPLTEGPAILAYIASLTPDGHSLTGGNDLLDRAQVLAWLNWLSGTVHSYGGGYGLLFRPVKFTDDEAHYPMVQEKGRALLRKCYARIDKHLADRKYLVGEHVTIADFYSIIFWLWGNKCGFGPMSELYPNYGRLMEAMKARKGVREVLDIEKETANE